MFSTS